MTRVDSARKAAPQASGAFTTGMLVFTVAILLAWAGLVIILSSYEVFDADPPLSSAVAILLPIGVYIFAFKLSPAFRNLIYAFDPILLSFTQSWRILGVLFLPMYALGDLPGGFAWPASVGDVVIAGMAIFVPYGVVRGWIGFNSVWMWALHILGIVDLIVAVSTRVAFDATLMGQSPLAFIPAFLVPLWIILHLVVIAHLRRVPGERDQEQMVVAV